jgi:antitoxin ParD1/3/4
MNHITLTPNDEAFIQNELRAGRYSSASELVRDALRLLKEREEERERKLTTLRAAIEEGLEDIRAGRAVEASVVYAELDEIIEQARRKQA